MTTLEARRLRGQLLETFKYVTHKNDVKIEGLFDRVQDERSRNNGQKLQVKRFNTTAAKHFFPIKITPTWNKLPKEIVTVKTKNSFKNTLDKYWEMHPPKLYI